MGRQSIIQHSVIQQRFMGQLLKCRTVDILTTAREHSGNNCYPRLQASVSATPALGLLQIPGMSHQSSH